MLDGFLESIECPKWWAEKYDLDPIEIDCPHCGEKIVTDKPFFDKTYVGLYTKGCSCGKTPGTFTMKIRES